MATLILLNTTTILFGSQPTTIFAGDSVTNSDIQTALKARGGVLAPATDALVVAASAVVQKMRSHGDNEQACTNVMLAAYASSAYGASGGGGGVPITPTIEAVVGGGTAGGAASIPIPKGYTARLAITVVGKITHKGGGSEAVGDTFHVDTLVTARNVSGSAAEVTNETEVSVTDSDSSMTGSSVAIGTSTGNITITPTNASGLNAATVVTWTVLVAQQNF